MKPPGIKFFWRGSAVTMRSHSLTVERASTSAPCSSNSSAIAGWLCATAHINAVCPFLSSRALTSAPASMRTLAAAVLPPRATTISAV